MAPASDDVDPELRLQDLAGIDALLQDYAANFRDMVHAAWSNSFGPRDWKKPDPLGRRFHCAVLRPCDISKETFEKLPGFRRLMEAAQAEDLNVAFSLSVCHFKPGPNAEGLFPISNPEASVSVRVDEEKDFKDTKLTVYGDKFAHTREYTVGLEDAARYAVLRPLRLKTQPGFLSII
jgi:hypothetical protein